MAKVPGIFFSLFIVVNHHLGGQKRIRSNSLYKIKWRRDYFAGLWIKKLRFKARQGHCAVFSGKKNFTLSVALLSKNELSWNSHEMLKVMSNGLAFIQDARILTLKNLR